MSRFIDALSDDDAADSDVSLTRKSALVPVACRADAAQIRVENSPDAIRLATAAVAQPSPVSLAVDLFSSRQRRAGTDTAAFRSYGSALAACARALLQLNRWCRAPIVIAQVIQLGLAWSFTGGDTTWLAGVLAAPAVVVLLIVVSPSTTRAIFDGPADT